MGGERLAIFGDWGQAVVGERVDVSIVKDI